MWRQRSRIIWLNDGDKNTTFFHTTTTIRRQKNIIKRIIRENGSWVEEDDEVKDVAVEFFRDLFTTSTPARIDKVVDKVSRRVTTVMNQNLTKDFTAVEIHRALHQMFPTKAPSDDGMPALFFQKFWHIMGSDVVKSVLSFF